MVQILSLLLIALIIGRLCEPMAGDCIPGGSAGTAIAGFSGAWLGTLLLGAWGPDLQGFAVLPSVVGAICFIAIIRTLSIITGRTA
jgi:uncharacterized membrane protein YeaQ/YmgE (transglycosylase-associated protein family)